MELDSVKSASLKLNLDPEKRQKFERHFKEFANAVNRAISLKYQINNEQSVERSLYKRLAKAEIIEGICKDCHEKSKLFFIRGSDKICSKCYNKIFGSNAVRKQMYPARGRIVKDDLKCIKNYARLTGAEFSAAIYVADSQIKGLVQQRKKLRFNIFKKEKMLNKFKELLTDETKRVEKELGKRERVKKYCHAEDKDSKWERYYTLREVERIVSKVEKSIEKLKKRNLSKPVFKGTSVMLWKNCIDFSKIKEGKFRIKIYKDWLDFNVLGEYQKELLKNSIVDEKYASAYQKDDAYYLNFPLYKKSDLPQPTPDFSVLSADRGINKFAVYLILKNETAKPECIRFVKGNELNFEKFKYQKLRTKMFSKKHGYRKSRKFGNIVLKISNYIAHYVSKQIVDSIPKERRLAIVLEDLEGIKSEKKEATGKAALTKKIRYKLSLGVYKKLQTYLVYKALEKEIPIVLVNARGTSMRCNKCGYLDKQNRYGAQFKCLKCGYQANADFNGAVNIGKKFYEEIKSKPLTFDPKHNVFKFQAG